MKKMIQSLLLAGLVGISASLKAEEAPKISKPALVVTRVQDEKVEPINRLEVTGRLLYGLDYYGIAQEQGDVDFYKARLQYVPLTFNGLGFGVTAQNKNSNMFPEQNDWGLVARLQGKPSESTFGKLDLRYFPDKETFDWYGFIDSKNFFLDCLGDYNVETGIGFIQPGIDIKLGKSLLVRLESKFAGTPSEREEVYAGIRIKLRF